MRICDLQTGRIQLTRAVKNLRQQWSLSGDHWQDGNRNEFDRIYYQPIQPQVKLFQAAVHRLADIFEQAERDCWDEDREE